MKRTRVRARFLVLLGLLAAGTVFMVIPSLRTRGYFVCFRAWHAHWPWAAGEHLPELLTPVFEPFVPVWVRVSPGVTMRLDPYDLVSRHILTHGEWEPQTWHALEQHLPTGGTFVDVGAHIGWYSLKASQAVGPQGHVIAVEPNRETLIQLRDNIQASGDSAVIAVAPVACSDAETTLTFYAAPHENTGESSLSAKDAAQAGPVAAAYPVRTRRLDDIVRESGVARVDAVKIDVEGAELLVLKGAVETLARYRPVVVVELADRQLQSMGASAEEVKAFLRAHGYAPQHAYADNVEFVPVAVL